MGCEEITWAWRTFKGISFAQTPSSPGPREDSVREEKEDFILLLSDTGEALSGLLDLRSQDSSQKQGNYQRIPG